MPRLKHIFSLLMLCLVLLGLDCRALMVSEHRSRVVVPPASSQQDFDADGQLEGDWRWRHTWDGAGRLAGMKTATAAVNAGVPELELEFAYDAQGRRIRKTVYRDGRHDYTRYFVYDGWNLIAELDGSRRLLRTYVWGPDISGARAAGGIGGLVIVHDHETDKIYYPVVNYRGDVMALVDADDGSTSATYEYGPYGEPIVLNDPNGINPFGFSSKYLDEETGYYYYGYRYYDPETKQWLSREPLGEMASPHLYAFVNNDPVNHYDYLGLETINAILNRAEYAFLSGNEKAAIEILWGGLTEKGLQRNNDHPLWYYQNEIYPEISFEVLSLRLRKELTRKGLRRDSSEMWRATNPERGQAYLDIGARILIEPYDWLMTGYDIGTTPKNGWHYLGLLPIGTAGLVKLQDLRYLGYTEQLRLMEELEYLRYTDETTNKISDSSAGSLFGRSDVIEGLSGTTVQGTRIADGISDGSIGLNIVGDSLFNRAFGVSSDTVAMARGNQIYLRSSSSSFLTDAVHEGTHALDFLSGYGHAGSKSLLKWENRAWFYERQFQQWTGGILDFEDIGDMFRHVKINYPDVPFNPY